MTLFLIQARLDLSTILRWHLREACTVGFDLQPDAVARNSHAQSQSSKNVPN